MKKTYQFAISGMTCHACESLITMDIEEVGFTPKSISHDTDMLTIEVDQSDIDRVKEAIQSSHKYTVTDIKAVS